MPYSIRAWARDSISIDGNSFGHFVDAEYLAYKKDTPAPSPTPPPTPTPPLYLEISLDGHCVSWPPGRPVNKKLFWWIGINPSEPLRNSSAEPGCYACMGRSGGNPTGHGPCWFNIPGGYRLPMGYASLNLPCVYAVNPTYFDACVGVGIPDRTGTMVYDAMYISSCEVVSSDPGGSCPDPADWMPCGTHEGCTGNPCNSQGSSYMEKLESALPCRGEKLPTEEKISVGAFPLYVAGGDFNNDNHMDLAVSGAYDKISILLGYGNGGFAPQAMYDSPSPLGIAPADYNKDGKTDLAIADWGYDRKAVSVLLNQGGGMFPSYVSYAAGPYDPSEITSADFNKDGNPDLAVTDSGSADKVGTTISVLMGRGDGTFGPSVQYDADVEPLAICNGDFNCDGIVDLAVVNNKRWTGIISVLLGKGDGTFREQVKYSVGSLPSGIVAAYLNGDGFLDLATCNSDNTGDATYATVSVLMGRGDGTFAGETRYNLGKGYTEKITVLDWNLDGRTDLAVTDVINNCVHILVGDGVGSFPGQLSYSVGGWPNSIMSADFNEDKKDDLAVANRFDSNISILINNNIPDAPVTVTPVIPMNTPTPTHQPVEVTVSGDQVKVGEGFWMAAGVNKEIRGVPYDAYVVAITPWGIWSVDKGGKWKKGLHAIIQNKNVIKPARATLLRIPHMPLGCVGRYTFIAGIVESSKPPTEENAVYMDKKIVEVIAGQTARASNAGYKKLVRSLTHGLARLL